ncbi:hypothetical protein AACH06_22440 [Ideonella sp. DXS29W]|uniref:Uncharacterized protein n=1 Tax=Ideonella lacteola TaxID=2984193 RepID=A0ABU9BYC4_9BURK
MTNLVDSRRRDWLGRCAVAGALGAAGLMPGWVHAQSRFDSRGRYKLKGDFLCPPESDNLVPWKVVQFQSGADFSLQADGKVLFHTHGLYELVCSADWQLKTGLDIDLRQIGLRLQRSDQPDSPLDAHERIGFFNTPGSDPPRMARYQGNWAPSAMGPGESVSVEVDVEPAGTVRVGDMAMAAHTKVSPDSLPADVLKALIVHAKAVGDDRVSVSLHNPTGQTVQVQPGALKVIAMSAQATRGNSGDAWQISHSASTEIFPGDKVYAMVRHKVTGTVLQATRSTFMQIDRVA